MSEGQGGYFLPPLWMVDEHLAMALRPLSFGFMLDTRIARLHRRHANRWHRRLRRWSYGQLVDLRLWLARRIAGRELWRLSDDV